MPGKALLGALAARAVSGTRKNSNSDTEWIPPPHLDYGQPRTNTFHHPEKLLQDGDDEDDDDPA
jgi:hypothetical protein